MRARKWRWNLNLHDITRFSEAQPVNVTMATFTELIAQPWPLALDSYQRPYVWGAEKVTQLVADLKEVLEPTASATGRSYYMGALLLHWDAKQQTLFVIDGQQRLTSLALLHHALKQRPPENLAFSYRSTSSVHHIQAASQALAETDLQSLAAISDLFERLQFSLIVVNSEDLAFTFFDTQNNRGVPLQAGDLLKAHHLRTMAGHDALQIHCAQRWESIQQGDPGFIRYLFEQYLWRARQWRGQRPYRLQPASHDGLLSVFQQQAMARPETADIATVPLYPGLHNQLAASLTLTTDNRCQLSLLQVRLSESPADLPFSLRQPVWQGLGFFLYSQRYASLVRQLFPTDNNPSADDADVAAMQRFYQAVIASLSGYLQSLFRLAVLMYVDRLGSEQLYAFACRLGLRLGMLRLCQASIRYETPAKYLRDQPMQLLDLLAGAWHPQEVLDYLQQEIDGQMQQTCDALKHEDTRKGTRGVYLRAVRDYLKIDPLTELEAVMIEQLKKDTQYLQEATA